MTVYCRIDIAAQPERIQAITGGFSLLVDFDFAFLVASAKFGMPVAPLGVSDALAGGEHCQKMSGVSRYSEIRTPVQTHVPVAAIGGDQRC